MPIKYYLIEIYIWNQRDVIKSYHWCSFFTICYSYYAHFRYAWMCFITTSNANLSIWSLIINIKALNCLTSNNQIEINQNGNFSLSIKQKKSTNATFLKDCSLFLLI